MDRPKKISQREARRLRNRVRELEQEKEQRASRYRSDYPGGVYLVGKVSLPDYCGGIVEGATRAGMALVAKWDNHDRHLTIYGIIA